MSNEFFKFGQLEKEQQKDLIRKYAKMTKCTFPVVEEVLSTCVFTKTLKVFQEIPEDNLMEMMNVNQEGELMGNDEIRETLNDLILDMISINITGIPKSDKFIFEGCLDKLRQIQKSIE